MPLGRDGVGVEVLRCQASQCNVIKTNFGERGGVARAASRVFVDRLYQLANGVHTVAHHIGWVAPCSGHQLVTYHQQAKVVARQETLDQNFIVKLSGGCIGCHQVLTRVDVDRDALALVAAFGFDDDR